MENCLPYTQGPLTVCLRLKMNQLDIHRISADRLNERDEWQSKFSLAYSEFQKEWYTSKFDVGGLFYILLLFCNHISCCEEVRFIR